MEQGVCRIEQRVRIVGVLYPGRWEKFLRDIERKKKRKKRKKKGEKEEKDSIENLDGIG